MLPHSRSRRHMAEQHLRSIGSSGSFGGYPIVAPDDNCHNSEASAMMAFRAELAIRLKIASAFLPAETPAPTTAKKRSRAKATASVSYNPTESRHHILSEVISRVDHLVYALNRGYRAPINGIDSAAPIQTIAPDQTNLLDWEKSLTCPGLDSLSLLEAIVPSMYASFITPVLPPTTAYPSDVAYDIATAFTSVPGALHHRIITEGMTVDLARELHSRTSSKRDGSAADCIIYAHVHQLITDDLQNAGSYDQVSERTARAALLLAYMAKAPVFSLEVHHTFRMLITEYFNNQFPTAADVARYAFDGR